MNPFWPWLSERSFFSSLLQHCFPLYRLFPSVTEHRFNLPPAVSSSLFSAAVAARGQRVDGAAPRRRLHSLPCWRGSGERRRLASPAVGHQQLRRRRGQPQGGAVRRPGALPGELSFDVSEFLFWQTNKQTNKLTCAKQMTRRVWRWTESCRTPNWKLWASVVWQGLMGKFCMAFVAAFRFVLLIQTWHKQEQQFLFPFVELTRVVCVPSGSPCRWSSESVSGQEGQRGAGLQRSRPLQLQSVSCQQLLQWRLGQLLLHLPQRSVHVTDTVCYVTWQLPAYFHSFFSFISQVTMATTALTRAP